MRAEHLLYILGLALAALLTAPRSDAAISSCSFVSTVGVNFGAYDVFNTSPTDSTGSITYSCTSLLGTITINLSKGSAPTYFPRQMRNGTDTLNYNLYLDAARVSVWGDGTGGTSRYGPVSPPLLSRVTVTIYGRIPARQNVRVGSYTDTITVTINF
jgi:spore coat protein U-like protein